jgi:hypothetical protein
MHRNNADLTRQLRDVQNDLITLRAENMQLKAANLQLQVSVAGLTDKLGARSREDERTGQSVQEEQRLRLLVGQLDQVVEQIQGIRSACLEGAIGDAYAPTQRPSRLTPADCERWRTLCLLNSAHGSPTADIRAQSLQMQLS